MPLLLLSGGGPCRRHPDLQPRPRLKHLHVKRMMWNPRCKIRKPAGWVLGGEFICIFHGVSASVYFLGCWLVKGRKRQPEIACLLSTPSTLTLSLLLPVFVSAADHALARIQASRWASFRRCRSVGRDRCDGDGVDVNRNSTIAASIMCDSTPVVVDSAAMAFHSIARSLGLCPESELPDRVSTFPPHPNL